MLIIERDTAKAASQIYFVDLKTGERKTIFNEPATPESFKITAAKPSLNGKYFLLKVEGETPAMMFAGEDGRVILAHLLCCAGFAVCLYSGTPRAVHLRQTDAMQYSGHTIRLTQRLHSWATLMFTQHHAPFLREPVLLEATGGFVWNR